MRQSNVYERETSVHCTIYDLVRNKIKDFCNAVNLNFMFSHANLCTGILG